jgi:hypothetical protein
MLAKLSQGERIVLVAGVLLIIDLLFVPWHDIPARGIYEAATLTGVQKVYAAYGIVAVILSAVMVVQIVLSRLLSVRLPAPGLPWAAVHLVAGIFVAVVLVIKLVRLNNSLGYGAYSGVLAGILVAYGGWTIAREAEAEGEGGAEAQSGTQGPARGSG